MSDTETNPGESEAPKDPADEGTELDALARTAREDSSQENLDPLWRGTLNLDRWFFAGVGKFPTVRPFSGFIDKEPYVIDCVGRRPRAWLGIAPCPTRKHCQDGGFYFVPKRCAFTIQELRQLQGLPASLALR